MKSLIINSVANLAAFAMVVIMVLSCSVANAQEDAFQLPQTPFLDRLEKFQRREETKVQIGVSDRTLIDAFDNGQKGIDNAEDDLKRQELLVAEIKRSMRTELSEAFRVALEKQFAEDKKSNFDESNNKKLPSFRLALSPGVVAGLQLTCGCWGDIRLTRAGEFLLLHKHANGSISSSRLPVYRQASRGFEPILTLADGKTMVFASQKHDRFEVIVN